ncbi:MAG: SpoIIE family protein phosphatase [Eubacteriales bacterium]
MAEWASIKIEHGIGKIATIGKSCVLITLFGFLLSRASIAGVFPFGLAFATVLIINQEKKMPFGFIGILLGVISVTNYKLLGIIIPTIILVILFEKIIKNKKGSEFWMAGMLGLISFIFGVTVMLLENFSAEGVLFIAVQSVVAVAFTIIINYAMHCRENVYKGVFKGDQAFVWLLILAVLLSGLQGIYFAQVNLQLVVLCFFVLYISNKYGAGSGAGAGAVLGFLLWENIGVENLVYAGIFGLLGFTCGGFNRFGKVGICASYTAVILLFGIIMNYGDLQSLLYSSGIALLLFVVLPSQAKKSDTFDKKFMPEIETTVSKVKTIAEIFDQLAYGYQAAGIETHQIHPEVPEMMNTLVERVCKNCPTMDCCWEREFYRTYNFMYDLFIYMENAENYDSEQLPPEWKKYCGKLKEIALASRFIVEQQSDRESWQKRMALNKEALAEQYKSVSQVIGHLAKELYSKHNVEEGKPLLWSRQHRQYLDMGVATFIKSGNGISGDNYNSVPLSSGKNAIIVCDGMGVGEEAARMSSAALTILEQLLCTGFEPEGAVKALNSILVLRSPEETFVTIDMAILDMESEKARLVKIGAAPTFIKKSGKVRVVKTSSLPVGILNEIEIPVVDINFKNETIVIVTDGVIDVCKNNEDNESWIRKLIEITEVSSAQELADLIVSEARKLSGGHMEDDGVVLVVKRKENFFKE